MKAIRSIFLLVIFISGTVFAASSPLTMLQTTSNQMLAALKKERPNLEKDPAIVHRLINKYLLPHVDIKGMSRSVLGRQAWKNTTSSQRLAFSKEFTNVVINTYSSAINAYTDETIKFYPIRGGYKNKSKVQVNSKITRPDGPAVPVSYRLILMNGEWKVYDLNVEGVSLLQSFRSQFAEELSQGKTVPDLIEILKQHDQNA